MTSYLGQSIYPHVYHLEDNSVPVPTSQPTTQPSIPTSAPSSAPTIFVEAVNSHKELQFLLVAIIILFCILVLTFIGFMCRKCKCYTENVSYVAASGNTEELNEQSDVQVCDMSQNPKEMSL